MDPADFVQELFNGLDREIQTGVHEVQDWIEYDAMLRGQHEQRERFLAEHHNAD